MADDFFERVAASDENRLGRARSPAEIESDFVLYGPEKRVEALDMIDQAYSEADTSDLRRFSELAQMRRNVKATHQRLLKAGR